VRAKLAELSDKLLELIGVLAYPARELARQSLPEALLQPFQRQ